MKKLLFSFFILFLILFGVILSTVFTQTGNKMVQPFLQTALEKGLNMDVELDRFSLFPVDIKMKVGKDSNITLKGKMDLIHQTFNIDYDLKIKDLEEFEPLIQQKLKGPLFTQGNLKGKIDLFQVKGKSDLAQSDTKYFVVVKDFNVSKVVAYIKNAHLDKLLYMVDKPPFLSGKMDLNAKLTSLDPSNLQGDIKALLHKTVIDKELMKKELGVTIPKTSLAGGAVAKLEGNTVKVDTKIDSTLLKILVEGTIHPSNLGIDLKYDANIKELALLKPITNTNLRGAFSTQGTVKGDKEKMSIKGTSNIADSKGDYYVELKEFSPKRVDLDLKNAKIDKLLYMVGKPKFIVGKIDVDAKLTNLDPNNLEGTFKTVIHPSYINRRLMKKEFKLNLPKTTLKGGADIKLAGTDVTIDSKIDSNLLKIFLKGDLDTKKLGVNLKYDANIKELALLQPLINVPIQGAFSTKGIVKGDKKRMVIGGVSNIASSKGKYYVELKELNPRKVNLDLKNAKIEKLLAMVGKPQFLFGKIDIDAKLTNLDPNNLKGSFKTVIHPSYVNRKLMKREFNIDLPKTTLQGEAFAKLSGQDIGVDVNLDSNLLNAILKGDINTKQLATNLSYKFDIKELGLLKPLTGLDFRGSVFAEGSLKGNKKESILKGITNLANSNSSYEIVLKEFSPYKASIDIKDAKLRELLHTLNMPLYANANIDSKIELENFDPKKLSGYIHSTIRNGYTNAKVLEKEFGFYKANISFSADQKSEIKKGVIKSDVTLHSSVADLSTHNATYHLPTGRLNIQYLLKIPDLNNLYFVTKQRMRGSLDLTGKIKKAKSFLVTAHSDTLGGKVDLVIFNDEVNGKIKGIKFVELTDMLYYPRVFDSIMDATLHYNLLTQQGDLKAQAFDGHILPNEMSMILSQMANFDITKEIYKLTELNSTINKKIILSSLDMKSRLTHITSNDAMLDMENNRVDAKLRIDLRGRPLYVKIKGDIYNPSITLDIKSLFTDRVKKEIDKHLGDKIPSEIKGFLEKLF